MAVWHDAGLFRRRFLPQDRERQIVHLPRVTDATGDEVRFADGKTLRPSSIVWATGTRRLFVDRLSRLRHQRSAESQPPGDRRAGTLLHWAMKQRSLASALTGQRAQAAFVRNPIPGSTGKSIEGERVIGWVCSVRWAARK